MENDDGSIFPPGMSRASPRRQALGLLQEIVRKNHPRRHNAGVQSIFLLNKDIEPNSHPRCAALTIFQKFSWLASRNLTDRKIEAVYDEAGYSAYREVAVREYRRSSVPPKHLGAWFQVALPGILKEPEGTVSPILPHFEEMNLIERYKPKFSPSGRRANQMVVRLTEEGDAAHQHMFAICTSSASSEHGFFSMMKLDGLEPGVEAWIHGLDRLG